MARLTPAQAADKWASRTAGAAQDYTNGVNAVTTSPTAAAAAAANLYAQRVQEAVSSGRYQNALNAVSLQSWQQAAISKGAPRLASGAQNARGKFGNFMQKLLPFEQQAAQQIKQQYPRGDINQNMNRAIAMAQALHAQKGQFK